MNGGERVKIAAGGMSAEIEQDGAQLRSLKTADGTELMWQGAPGYWTDTSPVLFPLIAGVPGGAVLIEGKRYPMPPHGFAHQSTFAIADQSEDRVGFSLSTSDETLQLYPFRFALHVTFHLTGEALEIAIAAENRDERPMPCDVGYHHGFRWPMDDGLSKDDYTIVFEKPEPSPIRRGSGDPVILFAEPQPTPVEGRVLRPTDDLFVPLPVVFDELSSRSLTFGATGRRGVRVAFPDSPYFALWMQPGAEFLCIEPWQGLPAPSGFAGELEKKPGVARLAPGEGRAWRSTITPLTETPAPPR